MAITVYKKSSIANLIALDGDLLFNSDMAFVEASSYIYTYVLDDSASGASNYYDRLAPSSNAGNKRWLLQSINTPLLRINNVVVTATAAELNLLHNQVGILTGAAGTKAIFYQNIAPSGWTIDTSMDDRLVYITKGSVAGGQTGGGAHSTGTWTLTTGSHVLTSAEIPAHTHQLYTHFGFGDGGGQTYQAPYTNMDGSVNMAPHIYYDTTANVGGGGGHTHSSDTWRPAAACCIICTKN